MFAVMRIDRMPTAVRGVLAARGGAAFAIMAAVSLMSCAKSLDMSGERIVLQDSDQGIVIGSVLVQAEEDPPDSWFNRTFGRKAAGFSYDFEIVRAGATNEKSASAYSDRYELDVKPGEERVFTARLPSGKYRIGTFRHEGMSAMGGELDVTFTVVPAATQYIGRLVLDVPRRVTLGSSFTYRIEDGRETTLAAARKRHPDLGRDVLDVPMQVTRPHRFQ